MVATPGIFDAFAINGVTLRSRVLRSSLGGRLAYYDGTPTPAWRNFERRFALAENRLGAIISATIGVDDRRLSPLEYPKLSDKRLDRAARRRHPRGAGRRLPLHRATR